MEWVWNLIIYLVKTFQSIHISCSDNNFMNNTALKKNMAHAGEKKHFSITFVINHFQIILLLMFTWWYIQKWCYLFACLWKVIHSKPWFTKAYSKTLLPILEIVHFFAHSVTNLSQMMMIYKSICWHTHKKNPTSANFAISHLLKLRDLTRHMVIHM